MKILLATLAALFAALGAVLLPVLGQERVSAKKNTPERERLDEIHRAHVRAVLNAFRRGDPSAEAEARATMRGLPVHDERRIDFAKALLARGEVQAAYAVERPKARFNQYSLPDDAEMAFYAALAERAGHPEEAAWARERTGEDGHFRVWMRMEHDTFGGKRGSDFPTGRGTYVRNVNIEMNFGLEYYPSHRKEIEALRRQLLAAP